jgi:hypothetical protein
MSKMTFVFDPSLLPPEHQDWTNYEFEIDFETIGLGDPWESIKVYRKQISNQRFPKAKKAKKSNYPKQFLCVWPMRYGFEFGLKRQPTKTLHL